MYSDQDSEILNNSPSPSSSTEESGDNQNVGIIPGLAEKQLERNRQRQADTIENNNAPVDNVTLQSVPESVLDELTIKPIPDKHLARARNRQELFLHKRRQSKNRKIVAKRTSFFLKFFTAIVMLAGMWLFLTAKFWYLTPQQIQIQHTGNGYGFIQDTEIIHAVQPSLKFPLYSLAPDKLALILKKQFPQIAAVSIRRRLFPVRLDVMITEKPIWGVLFHLTPGANFAIADIEQKIHTTLDALPATSAYKNTGIMHPNEHPEFFKTVKLTASQQKVLQHHPAIVTQKSRLNEKQFDYLQQTLALIQAGEPKLKPYKTELQWVDARNPEDIYLYFSTFKIHAGPIDPLLKDRTARMFQVLPLIEEQKNQLDYIDLAWRNQMTFKMRGTLSETSTEAQQQ